MVYTLYFSENNNITKWLVICYRSFLFSSAFELLPTSLDWIWDTSSALIASPTSVLSDILKSRFRTVLTLPAVFLKKLFSNSFTSSSTRIIRNDLVVMLTRGPNASATTYNTWNIIVVFQYWWCTLPQQFFLFSTWRLECGLITTWNNFCLPCKLSRSRCKALKNQVLANWLITLQYIIGLRLSNLHLVLHLLLYFR